jgi:hypothetical protein
MSGHTPWREIKHKAKPGGQMGNGERDNALRTMKLHTEEELLDEINRAAAEEIKGADSFFFFETLLDEAHPTSKLFYDKLIAAALLHAKKQRDYGKEGDPFANVRASEEWGVPGWVGAMIRATDKVRRLQTHATRGSLINESVEDSLLDLAVYSLIALVLYEQDLATKG